MRRERGAVLLEIVAAVTIFAFAATSALALLNQISESDHRGQARELRIADQDRLLAGYSLLSRHDLDLRLGQRIVGPYVVEVQRPESTLYRVAIGDSLGAELVTILFRPVAR